MIDKKFKLEIITPERVVYSEDVTHVKAPGLTGYYGILVNHTPMITALKIGEIEIEINSDKKLFASTAGFGEMLNNKLTILVEAAEEASSIDVSRAEKSKERALRRIQEENDDIDYVRARKSLYRALNRLEIATKG
jgi:F-type H+-transporting ATPase subunit epsilon